ncbi:SDR family NAD(P)-dependent oxidoreductase [Chloroflexota bacterium]
MDLGLAGKSVIVTGGGSNIGRGISLAFAKEGVNLVIAELVEEDGKRVAEEAKAAGAAKVIMAKTDVTSMESVQAMAKKAKDEFGRIDVLVNNVGWDDLMYFVDSTPEFWDKIININYRSVLNTCKTVAPLMIEQGSGAIVNIGSDAGRIGEFKEGVYAGTKGAIIAFSKTLAREVGPKGIRVNVVCPGMTLPRLEDVPEGSRWHQQLTQVYTPELQEKIAKGYPLRKIGHSDDIGNAVAFLASERAGHVTGQTLSVSGGYTMM